MRRSTVTTFLMLGVAGAALALAALLRLDNGLRHDRFIRVRVDDKSVALSAVSPSGASIRVPMRMVKGNSYDITMRLYGPGGLHSIPYFVRCEFRVFLRGASFTIDPVDGHRIETGTPLPTERAWSVAPNSSGSHQLVLDLSDASQNQNLKHYRIVRDVSEHQRTGSGSCTDNWTKLDEHRPFIAIPVEVVNLWGFAPRTFAVLQLAIAIVGFLLMCPGAYATVKWLGTRRRTSYEGKKLVLP